MTNTPYTSPQYLVDDYPHTLFPLDSTAFLVERFSDKIAEFVYTDVLSNSNATAGFRLQQRCYAAKRGYSLRRTMKLDPAAEYFIYDIVFRNRRSFRKDFRENRRTFGYRFTEGRPQSAMGSYRRYKAALAYGRSQFPYTLKVDVGTYFNAVYHHDLIYMVENLDWSRADVDNLGKFLREINAGRSVDCLPQGLHAAKVLGAEFLRFVDNSYKLKSAYGVRFLDDIHLFDNDEQRLISDLLTLQELLGEKGLSLNDTKTALGPVADIDIPTQVDEIKTGLLRIRREIVAGYTGTLELVNTTEMASLDEEQTEYLLALLGSPDVEESDAELVLVLLRDHGEEVLPRVQGLLERYPGLTRNLYNYARFTPDIQGLDTVVAGFLESAVRATEYQLFWLAKIAQDFLKTSTKYGAILTSLVDHADATNVSQAKVLEIPDKRFGLPEIRNEVLRSGASDWLAWAAAVGTRNTPAAGRNHLLGYFAKGGVLNNLVAECIRSLP